MLNEDGSKGSIVSLIPSRASRYAGGIGICGRLSRCIKRYGADFENTNGPESVSGNAADLNCNNQFLKCFHCPVSVDGNGAVGLKDVVA